MRQTVYSSDASVFTSSATNTKAKYVLVTQSYGKTIYSCEGRTITDNHPLIKPALVNALLQEKEFEYKSLNFLKK